MQWATLGKCGQAVGRTAGVFSNNSLVKIMEINAVIRYILTTVRMFGSQDYNNKPL